ncbi:hypothetical protein ABEP17_20525 [Priestia flexa]|uniref:hypothetical protein n=1 Tax=Priestia flexa TaxID=86664 RepID=UPI003D2A92D6
MLVNVLLTDGMNLEVNCEGYNPQELVQNVNNQSSTMIAIGDIIAQRHLINRVVPVEEPADVNIEIKTNDGTIIRTFMENYNAQELMKVLNNATDSLVAVGNIIILRYEISRIVPLKKEPVTAG